MKAGKYIKLSTVHDIYRYCLMGGYTYEYDIGTKCVDLVIDLCCLNCLTFILIDEVPTDNVCILSILCHPISK